MSWNTSTFWIRQSTTRSASLWGCELKCVINQKETLVFRQPPCEAVSWNAPYHCKHILLLCQPPCEAVSWNFFLPCSQPPFWCQPPCEAVSWNVIAGIVGPEDVKSASLWGCELKYSEPQHYQQQRQVSLLVRLWVEMLCGVSWLPSHQRSASLWGCELKWNNQLWSLSETGQPPCEAVSWNDQGFINAVTRRTSASLWGCELK